MTRYQEIADHYRDCFLRFGDSAKGADWPNERDLLTRYQVMAEAILRDPVSPKLGPEVLDLGCGTGMFYQFLQGNPELEQWRYRGIDIVPEVIARAREKFPAIHFACEDILKNQASLGSPDYILMNGLFTEKRGLSFDEAWDFFSKVTSEAFAHAQRGIAFNVMSFHVDWQRDDLFHVEYDRLAAFLKKNLSKNFAFRADYGLYEYTTYVYK